MYMAEFRSSLSFSCSLELLRLHLVGVRCTEKAKQILLSLQCSQEQEVCAQEPSPSGHGVSVAALKQWGIGCHCLHNAPGSVM